MIVYHGSAEIVKEPQIITSEKGRDFGFAFYTTDIKEQAERWAIRRSKLLNKNGERTSPVVNIYEWNQNLSSNILKFDSPSLEWLELVVKCRSDINFKHAYDIVIGKIANDNVGETVQYVVQGIMRKEDAVEKLKFEKINNQIAFCSEHSLQALTFIRSYTLEEK
ncbi:MAG: DUF3990 domain-containing protein [Treponema sp.]